MIGTLAKPRLHGAELLLQQHFRWVQLRWDSEPQAGLLARHLSRKLVHKVRDHGGCWQLSNVYQAKTSDGGGKK